VSDCTCVNTAYCRLDRVASQTQTNIRHGSDVVDILIAARLSDSE